SPGRTRAPPRAARRAGLRRAPRPGTSRVRCAYPLFGTGRPADNARMGRRTLVVDDHPLTRAALVGLLEQHGFPVVAEAGDGEEAIESARELQPDIALLDLSMPGLGGLEALPRLRAAAPGCEVVVLTASGTEENLLAAIRAGAAGYLLKTEPPE